MAEPGAPLISNQRLIIIVSIVVAVVAVFFLFTFRGCSLTAPLGGPSYTNIYTNLDLKDAANVITRLKELKIPYRVLQNGTAISVPKDKADDARLGLAEKNLPQGGAVGWEIFNETRMGATDFDRRVQLIRAISGELSRTIRRIEGVSDARVQIVIPETRLFEVSKAPVTAAVLLKIDPGAKLSSEQVNGIIHLVASSVENLKPENVTIVDDSGNILSTGTIKQAAQPILEEKTEVKAEPKPTPATPEVQIIKKEIIQSDEEKVLLRLKAKEEYERQLTAKVQELLNQFYPPNSVIVRVSVIFGEARVKSTSLKIHSESGPVLAPVKRLTAIVLVDNRLKLSSKLKKSTYQTIAFAVSYNKNRGDKIILKQVPFHYAETPIEKPKMPETPKPKEQAGYNYIPVILSAIGILLVLGVSYIVFKRFRQARSEFPAAEAAPFHVPTENEAGTMVGQIKNLARENPERIASLIKKWLTEEER